MGGVRTGVLLRSMRLGGEGTEAEEMQEGEDWEGQGQGQEEGKEEEDEEADIWAASSNGPANTWPLGEIVAARHDLLHSRIFNS